MRAIVHNTEIMRDKMNRLPRQVWDWELPVLKAAIGAGNIKVIDTEEVYREEKPDARDEYARLAIRYDRDEDSKIPHVERVYGAEDRGIEALAEAIDKGFVEKKKASAGRGAKAKEESGQQPVDPLA